MAAYYSDSYLMTMLEQPWSSFGTTFADCYSSSGVYSSDMTMISTKETEALHRTIADSPPQRDNVNPLHLESASKPPQRNKNAAAVGRRVTKRKSRASKRRQATTFFETDPANFREMVQQVTGGVRLVGGLGAVSHIGGSSSLLGGVDFDSFCSFPTLESSNLHF